MWPAASRRGVCGDDGGVMVAMVAWFVCVSSQDLFLPFNHVARDSSDRLHASEVKTCNSMQR